MSQFNSLSDGFAESLRHLGDNLKAKREEEEKHANDEAEMVSLGHAFVEGFVKNWYKSLDKESRAEVRRVFAELKELDPDEALALMKADRKTTPLGFVDGLFIASANSDMDEVEDEGSASSTKNN